MSTPCVVWLRFRRQEPPPEHVRALAEAFPNVRFVEAPDESGLSSEAPAISAVFTDMPVSDETAARVPALRWVHTTRGGAFPFLVPTVRERGIAVTTSTGVHGESFAEFALACMLAWANRLPHYRRAQQHKAWDTSERPELLEGKTLLVMGLGAAGSALAARAKVLGMRVLATKRRPTERPEYVDRLEPAEGLRDLLPEADYVVVCVASVPATRHILDEAGLRSMRPTAYLVNLTQNAVVDQALLIRALREGWIAGAALNVFPQEPLPEDSELWDIPNVLIAPHVAGSQRDWASVMDIFRTNLGAFLSGSPLMNVVDPDLGY